MTAIEPGDIAIGGALGYAELIRNDATFAAHIHMLDDIGNEMKVNGLDFSYAGDMFAALGPKNDAGDNIPHDVAVIPVDKGLVVPLARLGNTADLLVYNMAGVLQHTYHSINLDPGWNHLTRYLRAVVACDGKTCFYTDEGATIFRFDIQAGVQLTPFSVLPGGSPYVYGGLCLLTRTDLFVAESGSGDGPRRATKLGFGNDTIWVDEINPSGLFHVWRRSIVDGSLVKAVITSLDPSGTNAEAICIGTNAPRCAFPGVGKFQATDAAQVFFFSTAP